ncbi:hypothetical protein C3454_17935 [Citrobacter europaeus]|nr:hypothetical protein MC47_001755 [Citrobacter freundii]ROW34952.1 hypothetical protein C3454_17935 [Citrobacter europaeus]
MVKKWECALALRFCGTRSRQMQILHKDVFIPEITSQREKFAGEGVACQRYSHGILLPGDGSP